MSEEKWLDKFDLSKEEEEELKKQLKENPEVRSDLINSLSYKLLEDEAKREQEYKKKRFRRQLLFIIPAIIIFILLFLMLKYHQNIVERPEFLLNISFKLFLPISIVVGVGLAHRFYKKNKEKLFTTYFGFIFLSICALFAIPMFFLDVLARILHYEPWSKTVVVEKVSESRKPMRLRHSSLCKRKLVVTGIREEKLPTNLCLDIIQYNRNFNNGDRIELTGRKTALGTVVDKVQRIKYD